MTTTFKESMIQASIEGRKLANEGKLTEVLAAVSALIPALLEDVPPKRLEIVLNNIEVFSRGEVPFEMERAVVSFTQWVRYEMQSFREHGIG